VREKNKPRINRKNASHYHTISGNTQQIQLQLLLLQYYNTAHSS